MSLRTSCNYQSAFRCLAFTLVSSVILAGRPSLATDYYVRTNGNDKNSGRSAKQAFLTVAKALSKCDSRSDRVIIGAGTYTTNASISLNVKNSLEIVGDTTGKLTGDAGYPRIVGTPTAWSISISTGKSVKVEGLLFEGTSDTSGYGLTIASTATDVSVINCKFKNLYLPTTFTGISKLTVSDCSFESIGNIGLYARTGNLTSSKNQFTNCRYGVYGSELASFEVSDCNLKSDGAISRVGVYATKCGLKIDKLVSSTYDTVVYSVDSTKLSVENSNFTDVKSWGIYGSGTNCTINKVSITGLNKNGYGFLFSNLSGADPKLDSLTLSGLYCGLRSDGSNYSLSTVSCTGNQIGYFYLNNTTASLDGRRGRSQVYLDNNYIALYVANAADKPGKFTLTNAEISNNDFGLYTSNVGVTLSDCTFTKNARGIYVANAPDATLSNCQITDNTARNTSTHIGAQIQAQAMRFTNCQVLRNDYGLHLTNTGKASPVFSNVTVDANKDYGILVTDGALQIDDSMKLTIANSTYGVWTNRAAVTINNWTGPTSANYLYYINSGSLAMSGCTLSGGVIGVYANNLSDLDVSKSRFSKHSQHGLYANLPAKFNLQSSTFDSCLSHAVYCNRTGLAKTSLTANDVTVTNSNIGFRVVGTDIDSTNLRNLVLKNNTQGLHVESGKLNLSNDMNLQISGNQYGLLSFYGALSADKMSFAGNTIGLYSNQSQVTLSNCTLAATSYGALLYGSNATITGLTASDASYGIYFDPLTQPDRSLLLENSRFTNCVTAAIRTNGQPTAKKVTLNNIEISGGSYGIYTANNSLTASGIKTNQIKAYGVYTYQSDSTISKSLIEGSGSWSIYGNLGTLILADSQVYGGLGILLATQESSLINTIVSGTSYGVYANKLGSKHSVVNSTIAGVTYDGVLANQGSVSVVNTIIQAGRYGLYDVTGINTTHDYNLIQAGSRPFQNTVAQQNEIQKPPKFVNAVSRDFRLAAGSPAINAGTDLSAVSSADITGARRGSFGKFELGAYEYLNKDGSVRILDWDEKAN